jgi:hypothetical protein
MKKEITGYWMFVCNPNNWQIDRFLESGKIEDTYSISDHHKSFFQSGQKGIIRVGKDHRPKKILKNNPRLESGIYAIVEVISSAKYLSSDNSEFWLNQSGATEQRYRVGLRYIVTSLRNPVLLKDLIGTSVQGEDVLVINGYQGSTYPITKATYDIIFGKMTNPVANKKSTT